MFTNNRISPAVNLQRCFVLLLILGLLLAAPGYAMAAKPPQNSAPSSPSPAVIIEQSGQAVERLPLSDLLLPDGALDLSKGRAGTLDLTGYRLVSNLDEAPRFAPLSLSNPGDENWASGFHLPGPDGQVRALAVDSSGNLYAGGSFKTAGGVVVNSIAKWDGVSWSALGSGMSTNVLALAVYGSTLYAGGQFVNAGGLQVNKIAKWDGASWSALGQGLNNDVNALAVDTSGNVYAGGRFSSAVSGPAANHVAKWDGASWSALGAGLGTGSQYVNALALDGSTLYAGGSFALTGGNNIAQWNGTTWSVVGAGTNSEVYALTVGSGSILYAGGSFTTAGGNPALYIAQWNGTTWSAVGTGMDASVRALAVDGGTLYAGGGFTTAGGSAASYIARWSGSTWSALGTGMSGVLSPTVWTLAVGSSGRLYAGGDFTIAGAIAACRVASWQSSAWSPVGVQGNGIDYEVKALATDSSGNLYAAGRFDSAGSAAANRVAKWNGTAWSALGTGITNDVYALAVDSSGNLYAGGYFVGPGNYIARWNGSSWSALGAGLNNTVRALAISGNTLYVGGDFTTAGGVSANRIAKWDDTVGAWSPLVSGVDNGVNNVVRALVVDSSGNLYAGGDFTDAGSDPNADRIAKWNGTSWSPLGTGIPNLVHALVLGPDGSLYAGGEFIQAGGVSANRVAKWNGTTWSALGLGLGASRVNALAVDSSGAVYAGGNFVSAGGSTLITYLARWNGASWSSLGTGVSGFVDSLLVDSHGALWVGGAYRLTPPVTHYIGRWTAAEGKTISGSGAYTFYVNDLPITIQVTTQGTLARIVMQRFDQNHPSALTGEQTGRYWQIEGLDTSGGPASGFTVDMTLSHSVSPPENARVCRYLGSGTNWDCAVSSYTVSTVTRTGLTQFSDWAVGDASSPLAVDLANFSTQAQNDYVLVTWETTSELGNAGFNLYRSSSADDRRVLLAFVPSQAPGSNQGFAYSYDDRDVEPGQTVWYWLEDIDVSGSSTLHGPVSATVNAPTAVSLSELSAGAVTVPTLQFPVVVVLVARALASTGTSCRKRPDAR